MSLFALASRSILIILLPVALFALACGGGAEETAQPAGPSAPPPAASPEPAQTMPAPGLGNSAVTGTVVFAGKAPKPKPLAMSADPDCAAKHAGPVASRALVLGEGQTLADVFVQVKNPPAGTYPAPAAPAVIDQKGCLYEPYVSGVMAGQTLQFRNSDGIQAPS